MKGSLKVHGWGVKSTRKIPESSPWTNHGRSRHPIHCLVVSDAGTGDVVPGSKDSNDHAEIGVNPFGIDRACANTNGARNTSGGIASSVLVVVTRCDPVLLKEMMAGQHSFGVAHGEDKTG